MIIVLQPEIAYLKRNNRVIDVAEAPEGYLFAPHWQNIPDNASQEQLFRFMKAFLLKLKPTEEHD